MEFQVEGFRLPVKTLDVLEKFLFILNQKRDEDVQLIPVELFGFHGSEVTVDACLFHVFTLLLRAAMGVGT